MGHAHAPTYRDIEAGKFAIALNGNETQILGKDIDIV